MTTMLEKVARLLSWQEVRHQVQGEPLGKDEGWQNYQIDEKYLQSAKEVLKVMHEPIGVACIHGVELSHKPVHCCVCHTSWNFMLDKILDEGRK